MKSVAGGFLACFYAGDMREMSDALYRVALIL